MEGPVNPCEFFLVNQVLSGSIGILRNELESSDGRGRYSDMRGLFTAVQVFNRKRDLSLPASVVPRKRTAQEGSEDSSLKPHIRHSGLQTSQVVSFWFQLFKEHREEGRGPGRGLVPGRRHEADEIPTGRLL